MYRTLWRYASVGDALHIAMGTGLAMASTMVFGLVADLFMKPNLLLMGSKSVLIAWLLLLLMAGGQRFRRPAGQPDRRQEPGAQKSCSRVMVVGAGWAGASLIRELSTRGFREGLPVAVAVDDDPAKANTRIMGIPVLKGIENIPRYVEKYQVSEIVIAIPSASLAQRKQILDICTKTNCKLETVPTLRDVTGKARQADR